MDEFLNVWDSSGYRTDKIVSKDYVHQNGLFHATVHVWFFDKSSSILMQKRSLIKETFPGYWDVSVAGHVQMNEGLIDAAIRETREEIGIDITSKSLNLLTIRKNINEFPNGIRDCEFQHVFLCKLTQPFQSLKMHDSEIDDLRLFSFDEINECILGNHQKFNLVPVDMNYYSYIIDEVKKELSSF